MGEMGDHPPLSSRGHFSDPSGPDRHSRDGDPLIFAFILTLERPDSGAGQFGLCF